MRQFIRICAWDEFQHYKQRDPPWIKLHRKLLQSESWVTLDDASRALLIAIMLLAAGSENHVPADAAYIKRVAYLNTDPDLKPLLAVKFIELVDENGSPLASASTSLANDTKCSSEAEAEQRQIRGRSDCTAALPPVPRGTGLDWFLEFKLTYPSRAGDANWRGAQRAANARLAEGHTTAEFIAGAERYAAFIAATGKANTEFVQQASRFLGPDKPFLQLWTAPAPVQEADPMQEFRRNLGLSNGASHAGETFEHEPENAGSVGLLRRAVRSG